MANIFTNLFNRNNTTNKFNQAFYSWIGGGFTKYDHNAKTYLEKGYNINPDVYACINKATVKTVSVPYSVKRIADKKSFEFLNQFKLATKGNITPMQMAKSIKLETKAYSDEVLEFPLLDPNPTQTWSDIIGLFKTYMKITGNYYLYTVSPDEGMNKGVPLMVYALPAHLMQIVLKNDANMLSDESPIDHYILIEGNSYIRFEAKDIIHVKYSNPNFDMAGSHLYGFSPLRAALRNINSQNSAIDGNIKILQNAGAYGFLFGKGTPLTQPQADSLKEKLLEMDKDPGRLGKIGASSAEVGFQRIALTTDELKPFDFLQWDRKTICNVLNFPKELLGEKDGSSLSSTDSADAKKTLITDDILPDLVLLQSSLNKHFLPRFKGYENAVIEWDVTELPEMQTDMKLMAEALKMIPLKPNEIRTVFKYETLNDDGMDVVWMPNNMQRIDDVSTGMFDNANKV